MRRKSLPPKSSAKNFVVSPPQAPPLAPATPQPERLLDRAEVLRRIPVTYVTLWKRMRDGTFPRSRNFGGKVVWLESEIEAYIKNRPLQALKGDDALPTP
jgi:predicted DNA-binding transcriptional regulator AlpA